MAVGPLRLKTNSPETRVVNDVRAVLAETLLAICSPARAAELVATALVRARLQEVPEEPDGVLHFARMHLAPVLSDALGQSAADAVIDDLEKVLGRRPPSGTYRKPA